MTNPPQTQTFTSDAMLRLSVVLETIEIAPDLIVYRETRAQAVENVTGFTPGGLDHSYTHEGFITKSDLDAKRKGREFSTQTGLKVLPLDVIGRFRTHGFHDAICPEDKHGVRQEVVLRNDPFTAFSTGEATIDNVWLLDWRNHGVFDHTGKPTPLAVKFGYLGGNFHNGSYDLSKAAEHLLSRSDVVVFKGEERRYSSRRQKDIAANAREAVQHIPYYNAGKHYNQQIEFKWIPSDEDYARLVEKVTLKRMALTDDKYRAIFDLDLLGLRAAGAAFYDTYEKSRKYEVEDDGDNT
jgi:hypothetical protein